MGKPRVVLNRQAVKAFLQSDEVKAVVCEYRDAVMDNLGEGYEPEERKTDRAVATVHAATPKARIENQRNNTLLKALGAAKRS